MDTAQQWLGVENDPSKAGSFNAQVNDTWLGSEGDQWNGSDLSFPFYWVITDATEGLDGSQIPQATFTAVRESPPSLCYDDVTRC